jgi:hypothetical protein
MRDLLTTGKPLATIALFAFLGGMAAQFLMVAAPALARSGLDYLAIGDGKLPKGIEMYVQNGSPGQNFYATDGKIRLQMGMYTAEGERGLPLVDLNDNSGNIRMLLRLAGENESPVLIFKDKNHNDRMVMGLGLSGNEDPFLVVYDANGRKKNIFGSF